MRILSSRLACLVGGFEPWILSCSNGPSEAPGLGATFGWLLRERRLRSVAFTRCLGALFVSVTLAACQSTESRKDVPEAGASLHSLAADDPSGQCGGAQLAIHYINVGQAAATLIVGPNGTSVLYDFGQQNADGIAIASYLADLGLASVDYAILSHRHKDHYGGYDAMVAQGIDVTTANFDSRAKTPESGLPLSDWWEVASTTSGGKPRGIKPGSSIDLGCGASIFVAAANGVLFNRTRVQSHDENDKSVSLLIRFGDFSMTLDGDIGSGPEYCTNRRTDQVGMQQAIMAALIEAGHVDRTHGVDVIHMAHHGSHSSTGPAYFNLAKPEVAIASVGLDGGNEGYGHPRAVVVEETLLGPHRPSCVTAPVVLACFQTEDGIYNPAIYPQSETSNACTSLGDITITVDERGDYDISGNNRVAEGSDAEADQVFSFQQDQSGLFLDAVSLATFDPFFDDIDNPRSVRGQMVDMTPPPPVLSQFEERLNQICGDFGTHVADVDQQLAKAFLDFPADFAAVADRIRAAGITLGNDDEEFLTVLVDDWTRAAGFQHIFCGEPVAPDRIGGLHFVGRYLDLQRRGQAGFGTGTLESDGSEVFTVPVKATCPRWPCSDATKGYALTWSATALFAEGIIASHQGIKGDRGGCIYQADGGYPAVFAWKDGAIRTLYPDTTPNPRTPPCLAPEAPMFRDAEGADGKSAPIEENDCGE